MWKYDTIEQALANPEVKRAMALHGVVVGSGEERQVRTDIEAALPARSLRGFSLEQLIDAAYSVQGGRYTSRPHPGQLAREARERMADDLAYLERLGDGE